MPQFIACRFSPVDQRRYTYFNEGPDVAVGDFVKVPSPRDEGWKKVEVMTIVDEAPAFACKPILGKIEPEPPVAKPKDEPVHAMGADFADEFDPDLDAHWLARD